MLISAGDLIALYLGLELMSLALYVVAAFDRDNARSTEAGLKYFVLGALSSGMLLYGASLIYGFTGTINFAAIAQARRRRRARAHVRARASCSRASASRSRRCRSTCGRRTSTRARRRRSRRSSPPRRRSRRSRCSCGCRSTAFPGIASQWQQIIVFVVDRLDGARLVRRHRPAQHQAADGLFLDRPHGFRADRACRRHQRGHPGRARLHGDLRRHDARHLRLHHRDAPRRQGVSRRSPISPASPARSRRWRSSSPCCCSRWPACRRSPASLPSSTSSSPRSRPGSSPLAVLGVLSERGGRLLLSDDRQGHVFRRARRRPSIRWPATCAWCSASPGCSCILFCVFPSPWSTPPPLPRSRCSSAVAGIALRAIRATVPEMAGSVAGNSRHCRFDQCRSAAARRRRRARAALDRGAAADGGTRAAWPRLGVAAGQSLRDAAVDRSRAAGRGPATRLRRRRSRCTMPPQRCAPGVPLSSQMAERHAVPRTQDRGHPDRRGGRPRWPSRSASVSIAVTTRPRSSYPATDFAAEGAAVEASELFERPCARPLRRGLRQWNRGAGFAAIRAAWLGAADGLGRRCACASPSANRRAFRGYRRGRTAAAAAQRRQPRSDCRRRGLSRPGGCGAQCRDAAVHGEPLPR